MSGGDADHVSLSTLRPVGRVVVGSAACLVLAVWGLALYWTGPTRHVALAAAPNFSRVKCRQEGAGGLAGPPTAAQQVADPRQQQARTADVVPAPLSPNGDDHAWPSDGADPNGNSCRNGFLTSPRSVFWSYLNDSALSLTEVYHAEDRIYAVFHYKLPPGPVYDYWNGLVPGNWTMELLGVPGFPKIPKRVVAAYDLGRDGHGMTLTIMAPLPREYLLAAPRDRSLRVNIVMQHRDGISRFDSVPFCLLPLQPAQLRHLVLCTELTADVADKVPEWVAYHHLQGVEHFYLYIDDELSKVRPQLEPLVKRGLVTVIDWHWPERYKGGHKFQQAEQNGCLMRMRGQARWVALTDVDEFLQSLVPGTTVADFLNQRNSLDHVGSIIVQAAWWGTNTNQTLQAHFDATSHGLMLGRCRSRGRVEGQKMIANPRGMSYNSVHGITTGGPEHKLDPERELRLNHFKPHMQLETVDNGLWVHERSLLHILKEWGYPVP